MKFDWYYSTIKYIFFSGTQFIEIPMLSVYALEKYRMTHLLKSFLKQFAQNLNLTIIIICIKGSCCLESNPSHKEVLCDFVMLKNLCSLICLIKIMIEEKKTFKLPAPGYQWHVRKINRVPLLKKSARGSNRQRSLFRFVIYRDEISPLQQQVKVIKFENESMHSRGCTCILLGWVTDEW